MGSYGNGRSGAVLSNEQFSEEQVLSILDYLDIDVSGETFNDYTCFCPFHGNMNTSSMSVSKSKGTFICFNAACGVSGSMTDLIKSIKKTNEFQTRRIIKKAMDDTKVDFKKTLQKALAPAEFTEWKYAKSIPTMERQLLDNEDVLRYVTEERGFEERTIKKFHLGYNSKRQLLCMPMYSTKGMALGVVGRSVGGKTFKNSPNLPTSKSLWNIHNAKRAAQSVIVTEASFDAALVDQAGYPNVVGCLGGNFSPYHAKQLELHFSTIIIMTDFDNKDDYVRDDCSKCYKAGLNSCAGHNPGRDLGEKIISTVSGKKIRWASYESGMVYPDGAKDAGDMSAEQIKQCIENSVSAREYRSWELY